MPPQQPGERRAQRQRIGQRQDVAAKRRDGLIALSARYPEQQLVAQHVTGDRIDAAAVDRDPRRPQIGGGRFRQRLRLVERRHHRPRGHGVPHGPFPEPHHAVQDFRLVRLDDAVDAAQVGDRSDLAPADAGGRPVAGDQGGDAVGEQHHRIHDDDQALNRPRGRRRQTAPVGGAERLGNDLRKDQHQERQDRRDYADRRAVEHLTGPPPHGRRAGGVGDGVQGEDRRERPVHVVLEPLQQVPDAASGAPLGGHVARRDAQDHRLQHGAEKGEQQRARRQYQQERHSARLRQKRPLAGAPQIALRQHVERLGRQVEVVGQLGQDGVRA